MTASHFTEKIALFSLGATVPAMMLGSATTVGLGLLGLVALLFEQYRTLPCLIHRTPKAILFCWSSFVLLLALSILSSLNPGNSAETLLYLLLILLFVACATNFLTTHPKRLKPTLAIMIGVAWSMLVLMIVHLYGDGLLLNLPFSTSQTENHRTIILKKPASAFLLLLPLCFYILIRKTGLWRLGALGAMFGIGGLIIVSESRSAMAGVAAMLGIIILMGYSLPGWRGWRARALILLTGLIIGSISLYLFTIRGHWLSGALGLPGWIIDLPRQVIWHEIFILLYQDFPNNLLSGYGANALDMLERGTRSITFTPERTIPFPAIANHPHNWLLEVSVELGFFGALALLLALGSVLHWAWQKRHHAAIEVMALYALYSGFLSAGLFNYSLWSVWWQLGFASGNALCCALIVARGKTSEA